MTFFFCGNEWQCIWLVPEPIEYQAESLTAVIMVSPFKQNSMVRLHLHKCKDISDKAFIFDIFQNKGFVDNAENFLRSGNQRELQNDCEVDDQHGNIDNEG